MILLDGSLGVANLEVGRHSSIFLISHDMNMVFNKKDNEIGVSQYNIW